MTWSAHFDRALREAVALSIVLMLGLLLGRGLEYLFVARAHSLGVPLWQYEALGLFRDVTVGLLLGGGGSVLYLGLSLLNRRLAQGIYGALILGVCLLSVGLGRYFATTLQPLGTDMWAYSFGEVTSTVSASTAAGPLFWLSAAGMGLLLVGGLYYAARHSVSSRVAYGGVVLMLVSLGVPIPERASDAPGTEHLATNKVAYFASESLSLLTSRSAPSPSGASASTAQAIESTYPWMYRPQYPDVLGPYFEEAAGERAQPPNIVFIIFEGLGTTFVGDEARYGGFTPFVDSLAQEGLYWPNTLSTTGRTFGIMPSLFGSLPYAERGFMDMGEKMPRHQTLIRLLGERGYDTHYYSGFDLSFDNVDQFLARQGIDHPIGRQTLNARFGGDPGVETRYWGYPDKEMFSLVSRILDTVDREPRLEIYHTLQTHDPFVVPDESAYQERFEDRLRTLNLSPEARERYRTYQSKLTTFLYTDDALRQFFASYRQRPEFENTIFVITGDHRLIPIPQPSQIARYHVPLIVYSPLLARRATFQSVSTLADVTPTILSLLRGSYDLPLPERAHWLGSGLDTTRQFRSTRSMPLMRNKNQLIDYLHQDYYLAGDQLYRLTESMGLTPVDQPETKRTLEGRLARFKRINEYVTQQNRLYSPDVPLADLPTTPPLQSTDSTSAPDEAADAVLARIEEQDLGPDAQFQLARKKAFAGQYDIARAIVRPLLEAHPNYHDARLLLGRTYSWTHQFETAREHFRTVLARDETYLDAYSALADAERWAERPRAALDVLNAGLQHHPQAPSLLTTKAEILLTLDRAADARTVVQKLEQVAPDSEALPSLQQRVRS